MNIIGYFCTSFLSGCSSTAIFAAHAFAAACVPALPESSRHAIDAAHAFAFAVMLLSLHHKCRRCMQSIQRQGRWTTEVIFTAYCEFYCLDACLALGNWPGAANKDFKQFFHERFQQLVPEELIRVCFPLLPAMEQVRSALQSFDVMTQSQTLCMAISHVIAAQCESVK